MQRIMPSSRCAKRISPPTARFAFFIHTLIPHLNTDFSARCWAPLSVRSRSGDFNPAPVTDSVSSVSEIVMDLVMTGPAERHQIACLMCSSSAYRDDVMYFISHHHLSLLETLLTVRMHGKVSLPDFPPVVPILLLYLRSAGIIVVLFVRQLLMFFTILTSLYSQFSAVTIRASSSW